MEPKEKTRLTIDIDKDMHRQLKGLASSMGLSIKEVMTMLIDTFIVAMNKEDDGK